MTKLKKRKEKKKRERERVQVTMAVFLIVILLDFSDIGLFHLDSFLDFLAFCVYGVFVLWCCK